jgi:hypothetical protein
MGTKR